MRIEGIYITRMCIRLSNEMSRYMRSAFAHFYSHSSLTHNDHPISPSAMDACLMWTTIYLHIGSYIEYSTYSITITIILILLLDIDIHIFILLYIIAIDIR